MTGRSLVQRLQTSGGPSHELLVLLNTHRVMTTDQLAQATDTPVRTVRYRLDRLAEHHLVDAHRPGREAGSAPRHWWLRPAGARLVAGTPAAAGKPSTMFVAHAATITGVWLAVRDHGPAVGVRLTGWTVDRAGWQEWEPTTGYSTRTRRLTPDAVLRAEVTTGDVVAEAVAFIEVDLASMTQTQLREKLERYRLYATDRAWQGVYPHCPPLLLLTTTAARATTFVRTSRRVLAADAPSHRYRRPEADLDAEALVVAACGLVRDPGRAVVEPVWAPPEQAAAELTLAQLLAERVAAQARATAWRDAERARSAVEERLDALGAVVRQGEDELGRLLGDAGAGEALARLAGVPGLGEHDPGLVEAVYGWWGSRRVGKHPTGPAPAVLVETLRARHGQIWARQTRTVLAASDLIAADDPRLAGLAARLQAGHLLTGFDRDHLRQAPEVDRATRQAEALGDYVRRRAVDVERQHQTLGWRARRTTSVEQLAAAVDAQWLLACDVCRMRAARDDPDRGVWDGAYEGGRCQHCDTGRLVDLATAAAVPSLPERLADLRARLRRGGR